MKEKMSGLVLAPFERVKIELSHKSSEDFPHHAQPKLGVSRTHIVTIYFHLTLTSFLNFTGAVKNLCQSWKQAWDILRAETRLQSYSDMESSIPRLFIRL